MQFQVILTSIGLAACLMLPHVGFAKAKVSAKPGVDAIITDMSA
jgi:hypothetical protein